MQEVQKLEKKLKDRERKLEDLEQENKELQHEKKELQHKLKDLEQEREDLKQTNLQTDLELNKQLLLSVHQERTAIQQQIAGYVKMKCDFNDEIKNIKVDLNNARAALSKYSSMLQFR